MNFGQCQGIIWELFGKLNDEGIFAVHSTHKTSSVVGFSCMHATQAVPFFLRTTKRCLAYYICLDATLGP